MVHQRSKQKLEHNIKYRLFWVPQLFRNIFLCGEYLMKYKEIIFLIFCNVISVLWLYLYLQWIKIKVSAVWENAKESIWKMCVLQPFTCFHSSICLFRALDIPWNPFPVATRLCIPVLYNEQASAWKPWLWYMTPKCKRILSDWKPVTEESTCVRHSCHTPWCAMTSDVVRSRAVWPRVVQSTNLLLHWPIRSCGCLSGKVYNTLR